MNDFTSEQLAEWRYVINKLGLNLKYKTLIDKDKSDHMRRAVETPYLDYPYQGPRHISIIHSLLNDISFAVEQDKDNLKYFSMLFFYYCPTPFSKIKTREIIIKSLNNLSKSYDLIPLVYTTLPMPSYVNFTYSTWREIQSVSSFEKSEYGHLDILQVMHDLIKEKIISLIFFKILEVDDKKITFKFAVSYNKPQTDTPISTNIETKKRKKEKDLFEVKIIDREIKVNEYVIGKPHAVGKNLEFFSYVYDNSDKVINLSEIPDIIKNQIQGKRPVKILNELGFSGDLLKAFFPKRSGKKTIQFRRKISTEDLSKSGVRLSTFTKQLDFLNEKNRPK